MKSWDRDASSQYAPVLNPAKENFQMYAFCPGVNQKACGISDNQDSSDIVLPATEAKQSISTTSMKYVPSMTREEAVAGKEFEYDFCHYVVRTDARLTATKVIIFKVTKKTNMTVYIYGGAVRDLAFESLIVENRQPNVD